MNKRDIEDVKMQAREGVRTVLDEVHKEQTDTELKRALGEMWKNIPPEMKQQMAVDKPEVVKQMDEMYGGKTEVQGNPWGSLPVPDKSKSPFSGMKGR